MDIEIVQKDEKTFRYLNLNVFLYLKMTKCEKYKKHAKSGKNGTKKLQKVAKNIDYTSVL